MAILQVHGQRQLGRSVDGVYVVDHLVQGRLPVEPAEGEGESAAAGRQRLKPERFQ